MDDDTKAALLAIVASTLLVAGLLAVIYLTA